MSMSEHRYSTDKTPDVQGRYDRLNKCAPRMLAELQRIQSVLDGMDGDYLYPPFTRQQVKELTALIREAEGE